MLLSSSLCMCIFLHLIASKAFIGSKYIEPWAFFGRLGKTGDYIRCSLVSVCTKDSSIYRSFFSSAFAGPNTNSTGILAPNS